MTHPPAFWAPSEPLVHLLTNPFRVALHITSHPPPRSPRAHSCPARRIAAVRLRRDPRAGCGSPSIPFVNNDQCARPRIAAVQSRVAAPVVSGPRAPLPTPAISPFRDGCCWCSKCPRKGFASVPGLIRHLTHQHASSTVDQPTCALCAAMERVTNATLQMPLTRWLWPGDPGTTRAEPAAHSASSGSLPCTCWPTSQRGYARFPPTPCSTSPPAVAYA